MKKLIFFFSMFALFFLAGCGNHGTDNNGTVNNDTEMGISDSTLPYGNADWMNTISDDKSIADITIPGTHDSAAYQSKNCPHSITLDQTYNISDQLEMGVRSLDLRVWINGDGYAGMYHGECYLNQSFDHVIIAIKNFLQDHSSEAVMITIKQETGWPNKHKNLSESDFGQKIYEKIKGNGLTHFHLDGDVLPTLEEVRGKIVVFRRFKYKDHDLGYYLSWGDMTTGKPYSHSGYDYYVQDWYHVHDTKSDYDNKISYAKDTIIRAHDYGEDGTLYLNFLSGECVKCVDSNRKISQGIQPSVETFIAHRQHLGKAGVIFINFAGDPDITPNLVNLIVQMNLQPPPPGPTPDPGPSPTPST